MADVDRDASGMQRTTLQADFFRHGRVMLSWSSDVAAIHAAVMLIARLPRDVVDNGLHRRRPVSLGAGRSCRCRCAARWAGNVADVSARA